MEENQQIRITVQGYDFRAVQQAAEDISSTAKGSGAVVSGPVPLPTKIEKVTVNRSPHVNKKARDQFEIRTHKRIIDILEPTAATIDELRKLNLSSGVDITINLNPHSKTAA